MNKYKGLTCLLAGILMMMCLGTVYSWSVFRSAIEIEFQLNALQSGLPYMVSLVFYAIFMVLTGKHRAILSLKSWIIVGGLFIGLGWIFSSLSSNVYLLTLYYGVIVGSGVGMAYGIPMVLIAEWYPKKKGLMVGLVLAGFGLSPLISAPLARYLIVNYGLMATFLYLGLFFVIIIPLLGLSMSLPYHSKQKTDQKVTDLPGPQISTPEMTKLPSFKKLYLSYWIGTSIGLMIIGLSYQVGVDYIQASPERIAWLMSVFAICNGLGRPFFGWLTDRYSPIFSMRLSFISILIFALLMIWFKDGSVIIYSLSFCVFWFNLGGWLALAPATTLRLYGTINFSQNYGLIFTAYGAGALFGVMISGALKDLLGSYIAIFWLIIAMAVLGLLTSHQLEEKQ